MNLNHQKPIRTPRLLGLSAALAFAVTAVPALAQPAKGDRAAQMQAELDKRFTAADADGNGKLSRDEAKGKMPFVYKHFDEIDTAHAGSVTKADIAAFARTQMAARKGGG